jgi:hypothetical protein
MTLAISILTSLISINEVAMTRHDQQILFTALAFFAVIQKDGEKATEGSAQKVMMLAKLLGEFCAENVPHSIPTISSINDDKDAAAKVDTVDPAQAPHRLRDVFPPHALHEQSRLHAQRP